MQWLDRSEVLTFEEIERLARLFVERYGFDSIRLTGGEPTVRLLLVAKLARLPIDLALTTNAVTLALVAHDLAAAGLRRVNVSLDSLRRGRVLELTRRDVLDRVLGGIDAALAAGLRPVKLNASSCGASTTTRSSSWRGSAESGVDVRFIEYMPLDADGGWQADQVVPAAEIVAAIEALAGRTGGQGLTRPAVAIPRRSQ